MFHNVSPWLRGGTVSTETIQRLVILRPIVDKQGHKALYPPSIVTRFGLAGCAILLTLGQYFRRRVRTAPLAVV